MMLLLTCYHLQLKPPLCRVHPLVESGLPLLLTKLPSAVTGPDHEHPTQTVERDDITINKVSGRFFKEMGMTLLFAIAGPRLSARQPVTTGCCSKTPWANSTCPVRLLRRWSGGNNSQASIESAFWRVRLPRAGIKKDNLHHVIPLLVIRQAPFLDSLARGNAPLISVRSSQDFLMDKFRFWWVCSGAIC